MFMFLVTAWFKNLMVIYWLGKLLLVKLVKVHSFSGAKISCMTDHVQSTLGNINLNHIALHAGTDDLRTEYWIYSQSDCKSYNRSSDMTEKWW